ncbi:MAG: ATP phosphoribosyltransferase [Bacteroidales bacterium]
MKKKLLFMLAIAMFVMISNAQKIKGSDTMLPITQRAAEAFMKKSSEKTVVVTGGGSGVGISALLAGTTDLAMASRKIKLDEKIIIDFGLVNQAEYYSALIFRGYIKSIGEPVLSGGRYDELFKDFGEDLPATGFAINVDQLAVNLLKESGEEEGSFIKEKTGDQDQKIRIALTKGRLEENTLMLLEQSGYDMIHLKEKGRKLLLTIPNTNIEVVLAKAADVITYVEHGVCDIGVVGKDTIAENGGIYYEVLDLGFGKCKFALAVPKDADFYGGYTTKTIATKYPNVAGAYFESKGMDVEIIKIEGSVELAPLLSLADGIVDLVETGTTLKENGLEVIEDIRKISARLIVNEASMKLKKREIEEFLNRIQNKE